MARINATGHYAVELPSITKALRLMAHVGHGLAACVSRLYPQARPCMSHNAGEVDAEACQTREWYRRCSGCSVSSSVWKRHSALLVYAHELQRGRDERRALQRTASRTCA